MMLDDPDRGWCHDEEGGVDGQGSLDERVRKGSVTPTVMETSVVCGDETRRQDTGGFLEGEVLRRHGGGDPGGL